MSDTLHFTANGINGEMRIRDYLKGRLGFSTSLIAKVKYDNVLLNSIPVHMRAAVKNGDVITVHLPDEESECIEPVSHPIEVLLEDEHILAVNKPINMPTHPSRGNHLTTLAECVRAYLARPFVFRAVSRLDRDTSGIVLIAKNQLSAAILSRHLRAGRFKKIYYATVVGVPSHAMGEIDAPIAREAEGKIKRVVRDDGKQSLTKYRVISVDDNGNATLELEAVTGRTHQLRVHLAHIGHPLLFDFLYGEKVEGKTYHLHCGRLQFPHPGTGEMIEIVAPNNYSASY